MDVSKKCVACQQTKPLDDFYVDRTRGGAMSRCKGCWKAYMRPRCKQHYEANKKTYHARSKNRRKAIAEMVRQYKLARPACTDCKLEHPPHRLEFDHLPGKTKIVAVSEACNMGWSDEKVLAEIAKCEIVCANCHRDRTYARRIRSESNTRP